MRQFIPLSLILASLSLPGGSAEAQPLGTFGWQLQPFCNRVTLNVTQNGAVYTLDGFDDQCGAPKRAPLVGLAAPNPDGTIAFALHVVEPGGKPVQIEAQITLPALSGTWSDGAGHSGAFVFGAATGGSIRPAAVPGDITAVTAGAGLTGGGAGGEISLAVDGAVIQNRVTGSCAAGEAVRTVNQDGTVTCETVAPASAGDITAIDTLAGSGLTGGAGSGDVSLAVAFGGDGTAAQAARADHEHVVSATSLAIGTNALLLNTGNQSTAVGVDAARASTSASNNTAFGWQALRDIVGGLNTAVGAGAASRTASAIGNTAVGAFALANNQTGSRNVAIGHGALLVSTATENTAVGALALGADTTGAENTAVGQSALVHLLTGAGNTAVGANTGFGLESGTRVTLIGHRADVAGGALVNATAVVARARVDQSNSLVLGSIAGINDATDSTNVGIGTPAPTGALDVVHSGGSDTVAVGNIGGAAVLTLRRANGTLASPIAVGSAAALGQVIFKGFDGSDFADGARIAAEATQAWAGSARGAKLTFLVTSNNSSVPLQALTIDHDRQVGIGTTTPAQLLDVSGNIRVGTGTSGCVEDRDGTLIAGTCSSDLRLKRNIEPLTPVLDQMSALRPVRFHWRTEEFPQRSFGPGQSFGLIAQEVEAVLPELVTTDDDGYKAVNYSKLPLLAIQAIKELKEQNDELRASHAALQQRLAAIEGTLASIRGSR